MAYLIADTASVAPDAELADEVEIGPYCIVGPGTRIGRGTRLMAHVCILGHTTLGAFNLLSPFVVLGGDPQDAGFRGGKSRVEIGDHNLLREGVTINRAVESEDATVVGHHNVLMAHVHVAHDCRLGDHVTLANGVMLGGQVEVESHAVLSGGVAVHSRVTIGRRSFVGAMSRIYHDIPPFMVVDGNPSKVRCINVVGLKRQALGKPEIEAIHEAHRLIYRAKMSLSRASETLAAHGHLTAEVQELIRFLELQAEGRHGRARDRLRTTIKAMDES